LKHRFRISPPHHDEHTLLPAVLVALLVVAVVMQLLWTSEPDLPESGVGRVASRDAAFMVPPTFIAPVIMARPLFSPSRSASAGPVGAGASGPLGGAVVVGSLVRGRAARLFLKTPDGAVKVLALGGSYLGWQLVATTAESAQFARGSERIKVNFGSQAPATNETDEQSEEE